MPPAQKSQSSPSPSAYGNSYVQNLFGRFNLPSAREGLAAPAGDFYGLLSAALAQTSNTAGGKEVQVEEMSRSGILIPKGIEGDEERMNFISTQREKLNVLLQALDKQASNISEGVALEEVPVKRNLTPLSGGGGGGGGLSKSRSESEFERVEHDEAGEKQGKGAASVGGWMPWNWGTKTARTAASFKDEKERATTSGADIGR